MSQTREAFYKNSNKEKGKVPSCCHYKPLLDVIKPRIPSCKIDQAKRTWLVKTMENEDLSDFKEVKLPEK